MIKRLDPDDIAQTAAEARSWKRPPLIVLDALRDYLDRRQLGTGPLQVARLGDGHSCETFQLHRESFEAVLRRAPRPPWAPGVHNIAREAGILTALSGAARTPRVLAYCEDAEVLGAPFVILERVGGVVVSNELPPALDVPSERRRIGEELIDALIELHAFDVRGLDMPAFTRRNIDHRKHVQRLKDIWQTNPIRTVPDMDWVGQWLFDHAPPASVPGVVHGDYRLGNVLFDTDRPARLGAILDWETVILGDPLIDLGYVIGTWRDTQDNDGFLVALTPHPPGPGASTRSELVDRYASRSTRSLEHLRWYLAFSLWKTGVVGEGLRRRLLEGLSQDEFHRAFDAGVPELAARARNWIEGTGPV